MSSHYFSPRYGVHSTTRSRSSVRSTSLAVESRFRASSQVQDIAKSRFRSPTVVPSNRWSSILEHGNHSDTRSRSSVRSTSLAVESGFRASSQVQDIANSRFRSPTVVPSNRWSSILEHGNEGPQKCVPPVSHVSRRRIPSYPTYTDALLKYSRRLRERSFSPTRNLTVVHTESYSPYKSNMDYYRGKVKSIYEKEPAFKDFYRNIPLSETNFYDNHNITRIKHRFNDLVQGKMGRDHMNNRYDPYTPSGRMSGLFTPMSEKLSMKHRAVPPAPTPLPFIYVYHRNSRR